MDIFSDAICLELEITND